MVCSIIDECRCFAYDDIADPKKFQFCGVRRGPHVVPCPESTCCAGGCPGQTPDLVPREPFRIIKRPQPFSKIEFSQTTTMLLILILISITFIVYMT